MKDFKTAPHVEEGKEHKKSTTKPINLKGQKKAKGKVNKAGKNKA